LPKREEEYDMKRHLLGAAAAAVLCALVLVPAASAATQAEINQAVAAGASWLRTQQGPSPFEPEKPYTGEIAEFGGDWAATALAAAGIDSAEIVNPTYGPQSLQDHLLGEYSEESWTEVPGAGEFPRPATDYERAALVSYAAGLDPARISTESNLPAQIAGYWNQATGSFGFPSSNGAAFGILALKHTPVPNWALAPSVTFLRRTQHTDGGWEYSAALTLKEREAPGAADMTGAAIAAMCEAGVPAYDPAVAGGIEFLHERLTENGGFEYTFGAPNADSNAWAVSGLTACGIDPQSAEWTSPAGKTPVDFLLSLQITTPGEEAGSFGYTEPDFANLYSTQDAVRALAGDAFTATAPRYRTPPTVVDGTLVRHLVAIRLSNETVRMCEVTAPVGASLQALLEAGQTNATPAGCISSVQFADGNVAALDGVSPEGGDEAWLARLDRGPAGIAGAQTVGFGDAVALWIGSAAEGGGNAPAGPAGPAGETGATGAAGPQGKEGKEGKPGKPGKRGKQGKRGKRGPAGKAKAHRTCRKVKVHGHRRVRCTKARPGHHKNASGRAKARRLSAARALS
jgi:hypothetical protein